LSWVYEKPLWRCLRGGYWFKKVIIFSTNKMKGGGNFNQNLFVIESFDGKTKWDYLSHFLPLLSHSPPWLWWSRLSMIVWSTTSPQIKHRQLRKGPFGLENFSWIIIPLHRSHFTLSSPKMSLWDHEAWNKISVSIFNYNLLSFLRPSDVFERKHPQFR
jgi:hypothetical protein